MRPPLRPLAALLACLATVAGSGVALAQPGAHSPSGSRSVSDGAALGEPLDGRVSQSAQQRGGLTFYATRTDFDADNPGLFVEDFEDVDVAPGTWCASFSPVDSNTDDDCYDPGTLVAPLGIAAVGPTQHVWDAVIAHGAGYFGQPSTVVGANLEVDTTEAWFEPGVGAAGMDVYAYFGNPGIAVDVYDTSGSLLGSTTIPGNTTGTFFGVRSDGAPIGAIRLDADEDYTLLDDVAYGASPVATEPSPDAGLPFGLVVHPNPLQGVATVTLTVDRPQHAVVAVYDGLGRCVALLHDGELATGEHALRWEPTGLPDGAYVVRVWTGSRRVAAQRVTLVR